MVFYLLVSMVRLVIPFNVAFLFLTGRFSAVFIDVLASKYSFLVFLDSIRPQSAFPFNFFFINVKVSKSTLVDFKTTIFV